MKKLLVLMVVPICFWSSVAVGVTFEDNLGVINTGNNGIFAPVTTSGGYDDITLSLATGEEAAARSVLEKVADRIIATDSTLGTALASAGVTAPAANAFVEALIQTYGGAEHQATVALRTFTQKLLEDRADLEKDVAGILRSIDSTKYENVISDDKVDLGTGALEAYKVTVAEALDKDVIRGIVTGLTGPDATASSDEEWYAEVIQCENQIKAAYGDPAIEGKDVSARIVSEYVGKSYEEVKTLAQTEEGYNELQGEIAGLSEILGNKVVSFLNAAL